MKKIFTIIILGILILGTIGVNAIQEQNNFEEITINETISISDPVTIEENNFISVFLEEGNSYLLEPNNPMLPTITKVYTLPFKSEINSIEVKYSGNTKISITKKSLADVKCRINMNIVIKKTHKHFFILYISLQ